MRPALVPVALALIPFLLIACTHTTKRPRHAGHEETADKTEGDEGGDSDGGVIDPMGPNGGCYVCHMTFVREAISRIHLAEEIGCVDCHGPSDEHANDENIGATPPDIAFEPGKVDAFCRDCHPNHDVDPARMIRRWIRVKPEGELETVGATQARCTVCHGEHRIAHAQDDAEGDGT